MIRIPITNDMRVLANILGGFRSLIARNAGVKDAKMGTQSGLESDTDGILAEILFAKWMNVFPDIGLSPRSGSADMRIKGQNVDIKSTRHKNGRLLSTLKVNPDVDLYVLAIIEEESVSFIGYATKRDLIQEKNLIDLGHGKGYGLDQMQLRKFAIVSE